MAAVKASSPNSATASPASSPEATSVSEQPAQQPVQKRKGGRKPVYATQEERKMRNRAAQAAFRERRTEYIKHLEATIKHHEEQLSGLQQSTRQAADEVLMLRYKNSLLERILLEKGIDVAAELRTYAQYDDRPPQQHIVSQPPQPQAIGIAQTTSALPPQSSGLHRPGLGRRGSQLKRPIMNPGADAVFIKTSPDSLRPGPTAPAATIPTPPGPDPTPFGIPGHAPPRNDFGHPSIPVTQAYYPSPFQTHMEELGKLPRVLPIHLSFCYERTGHPRLTNVYTEREYDAELLENPEDVHDTHSPMDQQPTPDSRADADMSIVGTAGPGPGPSTQATGPRAPPSASYMFDTNFDSMFSAADHPPKHDAGLSDIMRQYNQGMPFGFATSNLR